MSAQVPHAARGGRPSLAFIQSYFSFDEETGCSTCTIEDDKGMQCGQTFKGKASCKLEKHVHTKHPASNALCAIIKARIEMEKERIHKRYSHEHNEQERQTNTPGPSRTTVRKRKADTITIKMSKTRLFEACRELTTKNGRPFSVVEDSGMRMIIDPIVNALREQSGETNLCVNRKNIRDSVQEEAAAMREQIKADVIGRLICLKLDCATRLERSVIGINIQFIMEGKIILRNLCVKQLYCAHTAENLKTEIKNVLHTYGISLKQIYSITTDNASNMIKTVSLLREDFMESCSSEEEEPIKSDADSEELDGQKVDLALGVDGNDEYSGIGTDSSDNASSSLLLWPKTIDDVLHSLKECGIIGQRCAAHTLELAVGDALKSHRGIINKAQTMCKSLRNPSSSEFLRGLGLAKPIINCETRWHSTADMLESLLRLKNVSAEAMKKCRRKVFLSEAEWNELSNMSSALIPCRIAIKKVQAEQLTVGDFLEAWLRCKLTIAGMTSIQLAQDIFDAMQRREKTLFHQDTVIGAIYIDPRYQVLLSGDEKGRAIEFLASLWSRLQELAGIKEARREPAVSDEELVVDNDEDPIESLLKNKERIQKQNSPGCNRGISIKTLLEEFSGVPRISKSQNILLYWESQKSKKPELYALANVALALPMTQVSVERIFSNLKFVLSVLRGKLCPQVVEDVLLVRCNKLFKDSYI
ncbi:uncharacterized protein LOC124158293 [Ischnura elegans]|uniref:uncharacterized protein LOC124158293 n=1 Tax=Ischnura elegans TaxID=197161 RepID=UPI001ED8874E|nr:uncharacterized protein LOC124158293 [Ischnura elegans]